MMRLWPLALVPQGAGPGWLEHLEQAAAKSTWIHYSLYCPELQLQPFLHISDLWSGRQSCAGAALTTLRLPAWRLTRRTERQVKTPSVYARLEMFDLIGQNLSPDVNTCHLIVKSTSPALSSSFCEERVIKCGGGARGPGFLLETSISNQFEKRNYTYLPWCQQHRALWESASGAMSGQCW